MRSRVGFTLFEALIATMILGVAIYAALQVSTLTLKLGSQSQYGLWAAKGVQEYYMEYFRSIGFDDNDLATTNSNRDCTLINAIDKPPVFTAALSADRLPGATCRYWVELETAGRTDLKKVTIKVSWQDPDNRTPPPTSTVSMLIGRNGLTN